MDRPAGRRPVPSVRLGMGAFRFTDRNFTLYIEQGPELADLCEDRILKAKIAPLRVCTPPGKIHLTTSTR
jgi:hypothetical protein